MKRSKRFLSLTLSIMILLGVAPVSIFANEGYSIIYKANGGTGVDYTDHNGGTGYGSADPYTIKAVDAEATGYTYEGHAFVQWNAAPDGSGESYAAGYSGTYSDSSNLELYAIWSLDAPADVHATTDDSSKITVSWTEVAGITHYKVERKVEGSDDSTYETVAASLAGTSYEDTTAAANIKYIYRVKGLDNSFAAQSAITTTPGVMAAAINAVIAKPAVTGHADGGTTTIIGTSVSVTAEAAAAGITQYYTLDGSTPTTLSTAVPANLRITAAPSAAIPSPVQLTIVSYDGTSYSDAFTHTFIFKAAAPADSKAGIFANSTYFPSHAVFAAAANTEIYYTLTTDGTEPAAPTVASALYTGAIPLNPDQTTRIKVIAAASGALLGAVENSDAAEFTYRVDSSLKSLLALKSGSWSESQKQELIRQVISQLTLDEKINLIGGTKGSAADGTAIKNAGAAGGTYTSPRLMSMGIAPITLSDGPAGVRMGYKATTWTSPTAIASSWDQKLMYDIAVQTGKEAGFYGVDVLLSPGQNVIRNPQSGRNFEYFSEDPYLSGVVAREYTYGVQSQNVGVTLKHFAGNEQETHRSGGNSIVSERSLREVYLKGFGIAAAAKPWSVMCSYNRLNNIYACSNQWLLTDVLRGDYGFDGFVMSDWGATQGITDAVLAQMDLTESSLSAAKKAELKAAIEQGTIDISYLDQNVANILGGVIKSNTFKGEYGAWGEQYNLVDKEQQFYSSALFSESNELARTTAAEAMVLLKNDNSILPLAAGSNVGLITSSNLKGRGGFGDNAVTSSDFVSRGGGSAGVYFDPTHQSVISLEDALQEKYTVANADHVQDIKEAAGYAKSLSYTSTAGRVTGINLTYSGAFNLSTLNESAASLAQSTNYGIMVISRQTGEGADNALTGNDGYYLTSEEEQALKAYADAFHSNGKKLIVILNIGAALDTNLVNKYADAILVSWLPGQEGGHAITDILSGAVNPSGKLTQTFTNRFEDSSSIEASKALPPREFNMTYSGNAANAVMTNGGWGTNPVFYDEGVLVGYRWFDTKYTTEDAYNEKVAYPFGYGLSYTKFEFSQLQLSKKVFDKANAKDTIEATVKVKNVGNVKGKEVVQLYLGMDKYASEGRPLKDLRGYEKVELGPGEQTTVTFRIQLSDLQYYDDGFQAVLSGSDVTSNVAYGQGKGWTVTPNSTFNVIIGNTSNGFVLNDAKAQQGIQASFVYGTAGSTGTPGGNTNEPTTPGNGNEITPPVKTAAEILKEKFSDASTIPSWAEQAIADLVSKGVITGKANGIFDHDGQVTRAEFLTMLVRGFGFTSKGDTEGYKDVPANAWFKAFVDIATSNGLARGIGANQFGPNNAINRQDLSVMIVNAIKVSHIKLPEVDSEPFADDSAIADYAREAVYTLRTLGIVNGRPNGSFDPKASATRAEAAVIVKGVLDYIQKEK